MIDKADSGALPLPLVAADIDAGWLTRAVRQTRPGVTIADARIETVMPGTSTKIRLRIVAEGEGANGLGETLIVKGGFEAHSPSMAAMYANEARFYAEIQPIVPMPSPLCHYAGSDPASHQSIVIMEDLARPGVTFCNALQPQSFGAIARRLEVMAGYHAATWASPRFRTGGCWSDIASRFDGWGLDYMQRYLAPNMWEHHVALPRGAAISSTLHDRAWMARALAQLGEIQRSQSPCLIHGDTHLGNLYVLADGTPGFFDPQVARTAWHHEVSYHIVCAADLADRAVWERDLLDLYLDALAAAGGPRIGFDAAWLDYRRSIVWGLFIFLINEARFQAEAVNTAYSARFGQAALDHGLRTLLP